jgi:DNA-binding NarL/FixJ family response regulator
MNEHDGMGTNAEALVPRPIRVVIVDDTDDLRFLLRTALTRGGMEVVAEAADGRAGIDVVRDTQPDVVLLDLAMPVMDGRAALPQLRRAAPSTRIIVLSGFGADLCSDELLALGGDGYIEKGHSLRGIVQYVEDTASAPEVTRPPGQVLRVVRDDETPEAS